MSTERDILDDAFAALREETRASSDAAATATRARLLLAATQRRRRTVLLRVLVPIAAVLAVSSAWAAANGRWPTFSSGPSETHETTRVPHRATDVPPVVAPVASSAPVAFASVAPSVAPRPSASEAIDREEMLYRAGHEAQFVTHDFGGALAAWDVYLAKHPRGRFAPEARYNRAIALLRLGRRDEARTVLRPFADGNTGGYRQKEAKELLDALDGD